MSERFWSKVEKTPTCWLWRGFLTSRGYGRLGSRPAHRVSWELAGHQLTSGMTLDHLCRVRSCVNPSHLEEVTNRENSLRGDGWPARNAAKTHCIHGHEFTSANTYMKLEPSGYRSRNCRTCHREQVARIARARRSA